MLKDANFRLRGGATGPAVVVRHAEGMEDESPGQRPGGGPLQGDRSAVEGVHGEAEPLDHRLLEADLGADTETVKHAPRADPVERERPAAAGLAEALCGHGALGPLVDVEPELAPQVSGSPQQRLEVAGTGVDPAMKDEPDRGIGRRAGQTGQCGVLAQPVGQGPGAEPEPQDDLHSASGASDIGRAPG